MSLDLSNNAFLTMIGLSLVRWQPGEAEFMLEVEPRHMNRQGSLQGGVVATLLDAACGYSGLYTEVHGGERHGVTLSLTINYVARVCQGRIHAVGRTTGGGRSIYFASGEIRDGQGAIVATAQGSFKRRIGKGGG
ncbi:PaaI family thioesterase (plasmid) [Azospirillum oryzae]|uniref:PaaI family thioesterase n=1 Tax=Azospirillum oryzae TaxID=286727 RepID=A0A6N1AQP6_9PROT|nr:PaaI family thioesterase [Azospirillum oryzae]QKS53956.1 PaaI family thioesterase [Azospirillum oryzae]GLR77755.1 hypothetical protein GCM10007856_04230 [Azospirillum oryzae]